MQIRRTTNIQRTNTVNLQTQNKVSATDSGSAAPVDQLDISAEAQMMSQTNEIRGDRVADIRAQIANGQYETPEKINTALDRMLDEFA